LEKAIQYLSGELARAEEPKKDDEKKEDSKQQ
jgi:hypothetical protein